MELALTRSSPPNRISAPGMHGWCMSSECSVVRVRNSECASSSYRPLHRSSPPTNDVSTREPGGWWLPASGSESTRICASNQGLRHCRTATVPAMHLTANVNAKP